MFAAFMIGQPFLDLGLLTRGKSFGRLLIG
jgi:hypothetical protein